jgi:hypothetical protein
MAAILVSVSEFRQWAGIGSNVPDDVIEGVLAEAESGIAADVGEPITAIVADESAAAIAHGEMLRRTNRLLARKNSPEAVASAGSEGVIAIPSRDPDSQRAVDAIRSHLVSDWGVA